MSNPKKPISKNINNSTSQNKNKNDDCHHNPNTHYGSVKINCPSKKYSNNACNSYCDLRPKNKINANTNLLEKLSNGSMNYDQLNQYLSEQSRQNIENQIKYNILQLINCKYKQSAFNTSPFGTLDWWKDNIWGVNKIQNYIYLISSFISFIIVFYLSHKTFQRLKIDNNTKIITFISTIILTIFSFTIILTNYKYWKNPKENCNSEDAIDSNENYRNNNSQTGKKELFIILRLILLSFLIGSIGLGFYIYYQSGMKNINIEDNFTKKIAFIILFSIIITFNLFFSFLVPQLIILGTIFQKIFFSFSNPKSEITSNLFQTIFSLNIFKLFDWSLLIKILIVIVMLFSGIANFKDNFYLLILFFIFTFYLVLSYFGKDKNINAEWNLLLMPFLELGLHLS